MDSNHPKELFSIIKAEGDTIITVNMKTLEIRKFDRQEILNNFNNGTWSLHVDFEI